MDRIALIGAGSLGTIAGALIAEQGRDIELIDTNQPHVEAMNTHGVRITGALDRTIPVVAKLPEQLAGTYDLVILLTKQTAIEAALDRVTPHLTRDSVVCALQNGTPEDKVASLVGADRTIVGNVQYSAVWEEPGVSRLATTLEETRAHSFDIGELDGTTTDRLLQIADILSAVGDCWISHNITGMKWSKLVINSTFSGLSAALGCRFGTIANDPDLMKIALHVADETIRTGWAHGLTIDDIDNHPIESFTTDGWTEEQRTAFFVDKISKHSHAEASMLQDLRKHIPTERDFINGRVIEVAEHHNLDAPLNRELYRLISQAEDTNTLPNFEHSKRALLDLSK